MAEAKQGTVQRPADKELVKVTAADQQKLAKHEEVPDFLRDVDRGLGLELMEQGDTVLPRIAIAQDLSPATKKNKPQFIEGLEVGMLYNTVTREIYGKNIYVIPVLFSKMRIEFEEMSKGGGILCTSMNGIDGGRKCPKGCAQCADSQFSADGLPPRCNNFMNYACILPNNGNTVAAISMKSTALAVAKQWNSNMRLLQKPAFSKMYLIESVPETRNNNDYFNFKVTPGSFVSKEIYDFGTGLYTQLKAQGIKVDLEDEDLQDTSFRPDNMEQASKEM